jgi:hypothetical protein
MSRPYYDVRLYLDEVYPGNVFGITVFLWANTGEIISINNMASGGITYTDNTNPTDTPTAPIQNQNTLLITAITITAVIAVTATAFLWLKKRNK